MKNDSYTGYGLPANCLYFTAFRVIILVWGQLLPSCTVKQLWSYSPCKKCMLHMLLPVSGHCLMSLAVCLFCVFTVRVQPRPAPFHITTPKAPCGTNSAASLLWRSFNKDHTSINSFDIESSITIIRLVIKFNTLNTSFIHQKCECSVRFCLI